MIFLKTIKKKLSLFLHSKFFFLLIISSFFSYILFFSYTYIRDKQNNKVFPVLYDLLERYQQGSYSSSTVPFEELLKDVDAAMKDISFFSTLKDQFIFLKISILIQLNKMDEASLLMKKYVKKEINELTFLNYLGVAVSLATSRDLNQKQDGIRLLEQYACSTSKFQEIAIFYYGYFLLKNVSLKKADEVWNILKQDPKFNNSPYKKMIDIARNCDY